MQGGLIRQTWLKGSDGRLYEISRAPGDLLYEGIYRGYEDSSPRWGQTRYFYNPLIAPQSRYESGYMVGRDAGRLVVGTASAVLEGDLLGKVFQGERQVRAAAGRGWLPAGAERSGARRRADRGQLYPALRKCQRQRCCTTLRRPCSRCAWPMAASRWRRTWTWIPRWPTNSGASSCSTANGCRVSSWGAARGRP